MTQSAEPKKTVTYTAPCLGELSACASSFAKGLTTAQGIYEKQETCLDQIAKAAQTHDKTMQGLHVLTEDSTRAAAGLQDKLAQQHEAGLARATVLSAARGNQIQAMLTSASKQAESVTHLDVASRAHQQQLQEVTSSVGMLLRDTRKRQGAIKLMTASVEQVQATANLQRNSVAELREMCVAQGEMLADVKRVSEEQNKCFGELAGRVAELAQAARVQEQGLQQLSVGIQQMIGVFVPAPVHQPFR